MKSRGRNREITTDLTPLIDVVFLLLIFFMVSTEAGKQENKPKEKPVVIELTQNELALDGNKTDFDEIDSLLRPIEKNKVIQLRVSQDVAYQRLVDLLDLLHQNRLSNISLVTEKER